MMAGASYSAAVTLPGRYTPEVLSSVALPLQPVNANAAAATAAAASSSSSSSKASPTYKHALLSQAVNPCMDLVVLLSRDVNVSHGGAAGSSAAGNDPNAGLPPPPPGMSAARSQALMRMRMAARAKALAAAGIKPTDGAAGTGASTSAASAKLTRCASLRLSLWRMASVAGERGTRVWDVTVSAPDRFGDASGEASETEDQRVDGLAWSPDGLVLALGITVVRRQAHAASAKVQRYLCLYALQDGQQIRQVPLPNARSSAEQDLPLLGMTWSSLRTTERSVKPGSVEHMLSLLGPLLAVEQAREDQEGKARQRQRMFQAMRDPNRAKAEADKKALEVAAAEPRSAFGIAIAEYPRGLSKNEDASFARSKQQSTSDTMQMQSTTASVLCVWSADQVHFLLDGAVYLGSIDSQLPGSIAAARFDTLTGRVCLVVCGSEPSISFDQLASHLLPSTTAFDSLTHLRALSTHSYDLLIYCYDAVVSMRTTYRTMHDDCIAAWNRRARQTAKRYATHLLTEVLMLLATGFANDTMLAVLLGSDTFSENDLNKMRTDVLSGLSALESTAGRLLSALQRLLLVFEELRGCSLWKERYGLFFTRSDTIDIALRNLSFMAQQAIRLARTANQEHGVWTHYYRWWLFERVRQEALRDKKSPADALAAAGGDVTYNVVMLAEFVRRGYDNMSIEAMLGIEMDAKTRGEDVEDDDEEVDDVDERRRKAEATSKAQAPVPAVDVAVVSAEEVIRETHSNGVAEKMELRAWYSDAALQSRVARTIKALEEPPTLERSFSTVGKRPPGPDDMSCVANRHSLDAVPAHGLAKRVAQHDGMRGSSLKQMTTDTLLMVAPWFKEMFTRWTEHVESNSTRAAAEQILDLKGAAIASGQADSIVSLAVGPTAHAVESKLVRTHIDVLHEKLWTAVVIEQDDSWHLTVITTPLQKQPARPQSEVMKIRLDGIASVLDVDFWSSDEIVLLVRTPDDDATTLTSIRLDNLSSARAHRSVTIDEKSGGGAKKLALNRRKDVCATLDDEGHLVYWDMVLQPSGDEHDDAERSRGTVTERDDEML